MIDQLMVFVESIETEFLVSLVSSIALAVVSYVISPIGLKYILNYISTESVDFKQDRFIVNSRWTLTFSFISYSVIVVFRQLDQIFGLGLPVEPTLLTIILIMWARVIHNLGQFAIRRIVSVRYDKSIIPIVENVWTFVIFVLTMFLTFDIWSISLTPILASAGIAGVVLGLAARETISNFFGSIALYADDAYQKGDYIELSNGEVTGYVHDISIRSTQLVTLSGNKVVVPNSKLHNSIIENRSAPQDAYRLVLDVGVSYDVDPPRAERAIREAVEQVIETDEGYNSTLFFGGTESYKIFLDEFGDSSINFKIFVKVDRPEQEPVMKGKFYRSIYNQFDQSDIEIPYPQRSLHFDSEITSTLSTEMESVEE